MRAYRAATLLLAAAMAALGAAMLVVTALHGGGVTGFLLGALFVAAGAGRAYLLLRPGGARGTRG